MGREKCMKCTLLKLNKDIFNRVPIFSVSHERKLRRNRQNRDQRNATIFFVGKFSHYFHVMSYMRRECRFNTHTDREKSILTTIGCELRENHRTRSETTSQTNKFYYIWSYDRVWVCRLFKPIIFFKWPAHVHTVRLCTPLHWTVHTPNTYVHAHLLQVRVKYIYFSNKTNKLLDFRVIYACARSFSTFSGFSRTILCMRMNIISTYSSSSNPAYFIHGQIRPSFDHFFYSLVFFSSVLCLRVQSFVRCKLYKCDL